MTFDFGDGFHRFDLYADPTALLAEIDDRAEQALLDEGDGEDEEARMRARKATGTQELELRSGLILLKKLDSTFFAVIQMLYEPPNRVQK